MPYMENTFFWLCSGNRADAIERIFIKFDTDISLKVVGLFQLRAKIIHNHA
jgi:hypothetical protein